jgi:hypothetical protein
LLAFIDYDNQTFAKPFNWTYTGKPMRSPASQCPRTWRQKRQTKKFEQLLALVA